MENKYFAHEVVQIAATGLTDETKAKPNFTF